MNTNNEMVSVVIPYWKYNDKSLEYLKEALQSLENQTYKNFEVILCIDTPKINKEVKEVEELIKEFKFRIDIEIRRGLTPNISKTRNQALGLAFGKYIAFLDADNMWHRDWLAYMINAAKKVYPNAVYSRAASDMRVLEWGESLLKIKDTHHDNAFDVIDKKHFNYYLNVPSNPLFGAVMINQEILDKIGTFEPELEIYETSLMMVKLFMNYNVYYVNEAFLYTRLWDGCISIRGGYQKLVDYKSLFELKAKQYYNNGSGKNV